MSRKINITFCLASILAGAGLFFPLTALADDGAVSGQFDSQGVRLKMVQEGKAYHYPEPVGIQIFIYGREPIGGARVAAVAVSPSGKKRGFALSERVLLGSTLPGSGGYGGYLHGELEDGPYRMTIRADDNDGQAFYSGGFGEDRPRRRDRESEVLRPGKFFINEERTIYLKGYSGKGEYPPLAIRDLYGEVDTAGCITLNWTIPENIGEGGSFEVRVSREIPASDTEWIGIKKMGGGKYRVTAGKRQEERICGMGKGTFHLAVRSVSEEGVSSGISNVYTVLIP